ncbi:MAG: chemotaxis protein CheB [Acidimicrobiia bacterium]
MIVQDEATSVVWGMPGAVVREGFAQEVVGLDDVASTIQRIVERSGAPRTAHHRADARSISGTMIGGTVR